MVPSFLEQQRTWYDGGTVILEKSSYDSMPLEEKSQYTDMLGAAYLSDSVDLSHYVPFTVKGDGNCLLHAAVVATNGGGDSGDLRERLASELVENAPFYRLHLKVSDKDWANSIESASLDGHYLGSEHIFALANVLRRPIILLDNKDVTAAYGEGELGSTATFLPTRLPPLLVVPPPVILAWASADHRHYVALVPKIFSGGSLPSVRCPQVAYESSLPPGRKLEDYISFSLSQRNCTGVLEMDMVPEKKRKAITLSGYLDVLYESIHVVQALGLVRRRVPDLVNFMHALSVAHRVPCGLSDSSYRAIQELRRAGRFPLAELRVPPTTPFADLASKLLVAFDEWPKYKEEAGEEVQAAIKEILSQDAPTIVDHMQLWRARAVFEAEEAEEKMNLGDEPAATTPMTEEERMRKSQEKASVHTSTWSKFDADNVARWKNCKIDMVPYDFLFETLMPEFPKLPILLGFLSTIFTQWPAEPLYVLIRESQLPRALVKLITDDMSVGLLTSLFRCLAPLLNARLFGSHSFPLIANANLNAKIESIIPTYPVLHFPSLSAFLRNYAQFCCFTRLISDSAREDHIKVLLRFLSRCAVEVPKVSPNDAPKLISAIEDTLIGIANLVTAMPDKAPQIKALIKTENLELFAQNGVEKALIEEFEQALSWKIEIPVFTKRELIPKVSP